ncbi:MAG: hypothetical protein M1115_07810 [Actinobacteria bacterium]|nr:hypothetical protein [Actinomycetota bacterium]
MTSVVNINERLSGHLGPEVHCVNRLLLKPYVPDLQVSGQVVIFITQHLGFSHPIACTAGEDRRSVPARGEGVRLR